VFGGSVNPRCAATRRNVGLRVADSRQILKTNVSPRFRAVLALLITGTDLSVIALIGIILLIGIVKKNAIMMIDFALAAERGEGKSSRDAIFQACLLRFRPILMTTMAALLGALPLALGTGTGSSSDDHLVFRSSED